MQKVDKLYTMFINLKEDSILEFGCKAYENVVYFNFETNPKLNETFEENMLIVFDEVQLCERVLTCAIERKSYVKVKVFKTAYTRLWF